MVFQLPLDSLNGGEKKGYSSIIIFLHHGWKYFLFFIVWRPSVNGNNFSTSQSIFLVEIILHTCCPAWGVWFMRTWPLGHQETAARTLPAGGQLSADAQNAARSRSFRVMQVRTQSHFKKYQWIFFFLSLSILFTFATVLKHNSLRFVFLVFHTGTFIKLWQFQFVWLSSQHQIMWTVV